MREDQIDRLLLELVATRKSFDNAVKVIKWNKRNTVIQYCSIVMLVIMMIAGAVYYVNDRRDRCETGNDLRAAIVDSFDGQASSIGLALTVVAGATPEQFQAYLDAYREQDKPQALEPRNC